ncbi:MAG: HD domain-containing protein, partial [Flavobacteriales bacterium]
RILNRNPLKIKTQKEKFSEKKINELKQKVSDKYNISIKDANYLVFTDKVSNNAYQYNKNHINILMKNGEIKDITDASDQFNIDALSKTVNKYFLCYPKI